MLNRVANFARTIMLNVVEQLLQENQQLRIEIPLWRDENARLKGEKGKPKIAPNRSSTRTTTPARGEV
jgi:hypothetical protein